MSQTPYPVPQGAGQAQPGPPQVSPHAAAPAPYGAVPPGPYVPPAYLDLTVQGTAGLTAWIPPEVRVNGWPLMRQFGRFTVPVPPGRVRVDVVVQWTRKFGRAALELQAAPGQVVPVFYATPYHVFAKGAIGYVKQRRPGLLAMLLLLVVPFVVVIGGLVAVAVFTSS